MTPRPAPPDKPSVSSVPLTYRGVRYRSHLEADWAAMFDSLDIYYQYEPEPLRLPSGAKYDPDFFVPNQHLYAEAKGAHNERLWKPQELAAALDVMIGWKQYMVVVLRAPGPGGLASWESADGTAPPPLNHCTACGYWSFAKADEDGNYFCCQCDAPDALARAYFPDMLPMVRAPRMAA